MPTTIELPQESLALFGNLYVNIGEILDDDGNPCINRQTIYGPTVIQLTDDNGASGITVQASSGEQIFRITSDGEFQCGKYTAIKVRQE